MSAPGQRWVPQPQVAVPATIPVPMNGINAVAPLAAQAAADAVYLYNTHASLMGVRVRDGWEEHVVPASTNGAVRTIVPYGGSKSDNSDAKLFCATNTGIYDVTAKGTTMTSKVAFGTQTGRAGWGSFANFRTAGGSFIAYCDEVNGYYLYTASTDTWAAIAAGAGVGQINGADPTKFAQVLNWKNRLWFVEKDTAQAWYLPIGQYAGTVASFGFGSKFPQGGSLAEIANFTVDGGSGVDDVFVAVSNAGDVAIYQGTDPAFADSFALKGYWNIGKVPPGRRFCWDMGGDMLILSSRGLASLVKMMSGTQSPMTPDFFVSFKVGNLIGSDMATKLTSDGWSIHLHPRRNMLIISVPTSGSEGDHQYAMYVPGGAWSVYRSIPMLSQGTWNGELYFGTSDGRVCVHKGTRDAVVLAGTGADVAYSGMTAYSDLGLPGKNKRIGMVRPMIVSQTQAPRIDVQARWDFDLSEIASQPSGLDVTGSVFDTAIWGTSVWGGNAEVSGDYRGASGIGQRVAIAFRGVSQVDTTLVSFDLTVDTGGML
jgi:hypothetical protein